MTGEAATAATQPRPVTRVAPQLVLGSVLGSTLGIVIAQFLDDLGDGVLAELLGGDAVLFNNGVDGVSDLAWAGGFILCLVIGFGSLSAYPSVRGHGFSKLTFLWMVLHVLRQALTQAVLIVRPFGLDSELAIAYETLDAPEGLDIVIAAAGGVGLVLIALAAASAFLAFAPHRRLVSSGRRRFAFVLWIAVIPAAAAGFLGLLFFWPLSGNLNLLPFTSIIFLATLAAAPGATSVVGPEEEQPMPWPIGLAITLILVYFSYQLILAGGVSIDPRQWG